MRTWLTLNFPETEVTGLALALANRVQDGVWHAELWVTLDDDSAGVHRTPVTHVARAVGGSVGAMARRVREAWACCAY